MKIYQKLLSIENEIKFVKLNLNLVRFLLEFMFKIIKASKQYLFNFIEKLIRYVFFIIQDNQLPP